ncbi:MAG: RNA polymerase sigma factor WhiG [Actinomycetota bacterium]|nr:RNA polymerase sigma factor WhiG [Actinomycetota bacterium]
MDDKDALAARLWKDYAREKRRVVRDELILNYAPLVKYVAGRISAGLPNNIERGDLVSYGMFGLIDAIDKFDTSKNIKFETYAISRIRGAIIDELRSIDWVPRSVRRKERELERSYVELEAKYKRAPTDAELAEKLEISIEELHALYNQLSYTTTVALEEFWHTGGGKDDQVSLIDTIKDTHGPEPLKEFEVEEVKRTLAKKIEDLPKREKMIIALYYYEGLTLKEIGQVLGVTESRVSQLHTKAVLRLKAHAKDSLSLL